MEIVAIPAAPLVALTVTPDDPLKSRVETLPPVPTTDPPWSFIVRPPMAPIPPAVIPVKFAPLP